MSIRTKISLWYAGLLTVILILFSVAIFGVIQVTLLNSIDSGLAQTSTNIIKNIRVMPIGEFGALETSVIFRSDEIFRVPGLSIQVWQTTNGSTAIEPILIQSSRDLMGTTNALDASALSAKLPMFSDIMMNQTPERVMTRPFTMAGGQQIGVIQIAASTSLVGQVTERVLTIKIVITVIGIIISVALGMLVSYRTLRPIKEISAAVSTIATSNDLTTRLPDNVPDDEIGRLTKGFNHMMARLQHLFGVQQRFVADLSHELRTPLTAIQGNLDMMQRYGADDASLEAIQMDTQRMTRMVNEVLMLARADYGDVEIELYPVELDVLVLDILNDVPNLMQAQNSNLHFKLGRHEKVRVNGNHDRLEQVILNLIVNAIKFTKENGTITVSVYERGEQGIIEVSDTGIGISQKDMERIFDRFFQVDGSRAHTSDEDGAGLGLSIVKWIVEAHGGTIEVKSDIGEGASFSVILPLLKSGQPSRQSSQLPQPSTS